MIHKRLRTKKLGEIERTPNFLNCSHLVFILKRVFWIYLIDE